MTTRALLPALISNPRVGVHGDENPQPIKPANSAKICQTSEVLGKGFRPLEEREGKQGNPRANVRRLAVFRYTSW